MAAAGGAILFVSLLAGALLLVGACVWGLLGLLIMKEISVAEFVLYTGVFLGLIVTGTLGSGPLRRAGLILAVGLAIGFPLLRKWANSHALAKMDQEDIDKYRESLAKRPQIPYPYRRLGEIYHRRGHYDVAVDWYRKYLQFTHDAEVERRIKRCVALMEKAKQHPKICTECHHENLADARYCANCGAILPGAWEILSLFRGKAGARYLLTVAVLSLLVGLVLGAVTSLNYIYAMLCFWNAVAAFVYYLYKRVTMY